MLEQDAAQFARLIMGIGEIYRWHLTPVAIEAYWRTLEAFSLEEVRAAIYRHLQNPDVGKYFSKPADIIMAIDGSSQNQALLAWSKTARAIRMVGGYVSVAFDDPLIHLVITDMNNWIKLCEVEEKYLPFSAKEFQERYRGYVNRKPASHPKYLIGRLELQNSANSYSYPLPVLIGDCLKAQEVIATGENKPLLAVHVKETTKLLSKNCITKFVSRALQSKTLINQT